MKVCDYKTTRHIWCKHLSKFIILQRLAKTQLEITQRIVGWYFWLYLFSYSYTDNLKKKQWEEYIMVFRSLAPEIHSWSVGLAINNLQTRLYRVRL